MRLKVTGTVVVDQAHLKKESDMKIMMYYDGTDCTKEALPVVMMRAKAFGAEVHVVASLPSGEEKDLKTIDRMNVDLDYIQSVFETQQVPCETHLLITGRGAGEDIVTFARKHEVDEIVIATDRRTMMERLMANWMARRVMSDTRCPVLLT